MDELPPARGVIIGRVAVTVQDPLGGQESLDPHGAAGVDPAGGDADLGAESETVAVGHPAGAVGEDAGRVDGVEEGLLGVGVLRDDHVGVGGAVLVDVVDGIVDVLDQLDRALHVTVLVSERNGLRK